jgi:hypothetical protein
MLSFVAVAAFAGSGWAAELRPVDEGLKDPAFAEFRARLHDIIGRNDFDGLIRMLSPHIRNSFGADEGIPEFKEAWKGREPTLWRELAFIVGNGGKFMEGQFCAPYVYSHWPAGYDAFENFAALTAGNVGLMNSRAGKSAVLATLSYTIVKVLDDEWWERVGGRVRVKAGGKIGFVPREALRSPIEYRACFERQNGQWKMRSLLAGD